MGIGCANDVKLLRCVGSKTYTGGADLEMQKLARSTVGQNDRRLRIDLPHHAKNKHRGGEHKGLDTLLANRESRRADLRPDFLRDEQTPLNKVEKQRLDARRDAHSKRVKAKPGELSVAENNAIPQMPDDPESLNDMARRLLSGWGL